MAMMRCIRCGKEFSASAPDGRVASISGSILGDECTDTYYFCKDCGVYTVEVCYDNFTGTEEISVRGPLSKAEGDAQVAQIRQCSRPWDKKCRCAAHRAYFRDTLD